MQKITSSTELKDAILQLESKQAMEWQALKEHFTIVKEKYTPGKVIKRTLAEVFTFQNLLRTALSGIFGLTTAYISRKYLKGYSGSVLNKVLDTFL